MKKLHLFLMFSLTLIAIVGAIFGPRLMRKFSATEKKDHPGFIVSVENPGGKETIIDATDFPDRRKFVFIKNGQEVATRKEADTIIPITRIDVFKGPDNSVLEIHEQGPEGQSLRRTYSR
ncbi:MAG: hypothetical protein V4598_09645 [Bdellovibrionota bacterium]